MRELEARLGERIALRLAREIAEIYARRPAGERPLEAANDRLFEVVSDGETARVLQGTASQRIAIARVPGRVVLDGIATLKSATLHFERYALD